MKTIHSLLRFKYLYEEYLRTGNMEYFRAHGRQVPLDEALRAVNGVISRFRAEEGDWDKVISELEKLKDNLKEKASDHDE